MDVFLTYLPLPTFLIFLDGAYLPILFLFVVVYLPLNHIFIFWVRNLAFRNPPITQKLLRIVGRHRYLRAGDRACAALPCTLPASSPRGQGQGLRPSWTNPPPLLRGQRGRCPSDSPAPSAGPYRVFRVVTRDMATSLRFLRHILRSSLFSTVR